MSMMNGDGTGTTGSGTAATSTPLPPDEADHVPQRAPYSPPTEKDLEWVSVVRQNFQKARQERRPRVNQWLKNYRIVNGRTWSASRPSHLPDPEVPEIYPILSSCVGWMTDQRIIPKTTPLAVPNSPFAMMLGEMGETMDAVLNSILVANGSLTAQLEAACWDLYLYAVGWLKTTWDATADGGLGNPTIRRCDPFTIYPDPKATCMDDLSYICEVRTLSLNELQKRFGTNAAARIAAQGWREEHDSSPSLTREGGVLDAPKATPGTITTGIPSYGLPGQGRSLGQIDDPGYTIIECWMREMRDVEVTVNGKQDTRRYMSWRCVIVCGNILLFNEMAEDMWLHCDHPFTHLTLQQTGEIYGVSMAEQLTPMQLSINRLLAAIEHNIWLIGNPVFKESNRSNIARSKITNRPGERLSVTEGATAEWMVPPQMYPRESTDLIKLYIDEMERVSGLSAMNRGMAPTGRNSTEVLDNVQEASFVRIRMGLRNLERSLTRALGMAASLVVEFYDVPRLMAIVGPDGEETSVALRSKNFWLPDAADPANTSLPMRFSLSVSAGASRHMSRVAKAQEADFLFAMGALDVPAVLEAHEWPGRAAIGKRVQEAQAAGTHQPPGARQRAQRTS